MYCSLQSVGISAVVRVQNCSTSAALATADSSPSRYCCFAFKRGYSDQQTFSSAVRKIQHQHLRSLRAALLQPGRTMAE